MKKFPYKKVHMVGIGGISMSGLAKILMKMDVRVSGSDIKDSEDLHELKKNGAEIFVGHDTTCLNNDVELVVVTAAVGDDNPEVIKAKKLGLPVWRRSQLIGFLMRDQIGICIAGMHGKSTTSTIIAELFYLMGEDPTVMVGAVVKSFDSNSRYGKGDIVVAESCEFNRSFLDFEPTIEVILNIEEEHLDTYKDLSDIMDSFEVFGKKVPEKGLLVGCLDDANVSELFLRLDKIKIGYGFNDRPESFDGVYWQIVDYHKKDGYSKWKLIIDGEKIDIDFTLKLPGEFNVLNATAALIVADFLVLDLESCAEKLSTIMGSKRRFDILGEKKGVLVIDDYGHHPTEIVNSIKAVKDYYPNRKLWAMFWPHQYNRTEQFFDGFVKAFDRVDKLIILDVYEARVCDTDKTKYNSKVLSELIEKRGVDVNYIAQEKDALKYIKKNIAKNSVLLTQGAGPVDNIAKNFLK